MHLHLRCTPHHLHHRIPIPAKAFRAFNWIMHHGSIPTEASYGVYLMADGKCHAADATVIAGAALAGYVNVTSGDVEVVLDTLGSKGPLAVAIDASPREFGFYSSGVFYSDSCGNTPDALDHAVLAVGYGTDPVVSEMGTYTSLAHPTSAHALDRVIEVPLSHLTTHVALLGQFARHRLNGALLTCCDGVLCLAPRVEIIGLSKILGLHTMVTMAISRCRARTTIVGSLLMLTCRS